MLSKYKKVNQYLGVRGELTLPNVCIITGEPVDGGSIQTTVVQRFFSPLQVILLSISTTSLFFVKYAFLFYASLYIFYRFSTRRRLPIDIEFCISQRAIRNSILWNFCAAVVFAVLVAYYERLFPGLLGAWLIHYCLGRTELFIVKSERDYILLQGLSSKAIDNIDDLDIEFSRPYDKKKNNIVKESIETVPSSLIIAPPHDSLVAHMPSKNTGTIDISNRNLSSIPQEIFLNTELSCVQKLLAANNSFGQIPEILLLLENLTHLDLSNTRLKTLSSIGELDDLTQLYVSSNRLKEIPKDIRKLHLLTTFDASSNRIDSIPAEITFTSLLQLKLHNNFISDIPEELVHLHNLTHLDLSNNKINSIPENIGALKNLEYLYLHNNNIVSLPTSIVRLKKLKKLNLSNNKLTKIPDEITELIELQVLNLANNEICEISERSIQQLRQLDLENNRLLQITIDFPYMTSLNVAKNNIEKISQEIVCCSKMQKLNLSDNKLTTLPKQIFENSSLKELLVNSNQLSEIPCPKKLRQLIRLELRDNLLQKLPHSLTELRACAVDVRGNLDLDIPPQLLDKVKYDKLKLNNFDKSLPKNPLVLQTSSYVFQLAIEECVSYTHVEKYEEKCYVWNDNKLQEIPKSFDHLPKNTVVVKDNKLYFVKEKRRFKIKRNFSHYALLLPYPSESSLSNCFVAYDGNDFCYLEIFNASLSFDEKFISRLTRDVKRICDAKPSAASKIYAFDKFQEQIYIKAIFLKGISLKSHVNSCAFSLDENIYWMVQLLTVLSKLPVQSELITLNNIYLYHHFIHLVGMATIKSKYPFEKDFEQVGEINNDKYYFFSPEIYSSGDVNEQSSIYSLGVVFYFFLTGKYPFKQKRLFQLILEIMKGKHVNIAADNPFLDSHPICDIVHRMLARNPKDRYANEQEIIRDIKVKYPQNFVQNFCLFKTDNLDTDYKLHVAVDIDSGELCQIAFFEKELDLPIDDLTHFCSQIQYIPAKKGSYVVFPYEYFDTLDEYAKKSQLLPCKITYFALEIIEFLEKLAKSKLMPLLNEKMIIVNHKGRVLLHLPTIIEQFGNKSPETLSIISLEKACNFNTENEIYYRLPQEIFTPEYNITAQIYSLGVAMYNMVSQEYPYDKEELLQMQSIYHKRRLLSDEGIPSSLRKIINKMISYLDPTYNNWQELQKDLECSYYTLISFK